MSVMIPMIEVGVHKDCYYILIDGVYNKVSRVDLSKLYHRIGDVLDQA
jgi:hypothetical protein